MTTANDSILVTPGSGASVATHNPGDGKEYQVVMLAGDKGHVYGTKPSYLLFVPVSAVGANKIYFDLFNAAGSGRTIEINCLRAVAKTDMAVTGVLGVELQVAKTSTVGTAGTAATYNGTSFAAPAITPKDSNNAALPAQITARAVPTGGATVAAALWQNYVHTEESSIASYLSQYFNLMPAETTESQSLLLNEGQGLRVAQGTIASVGSLGFLVDFTVI